jgi:hypothetical protein
MIDLRDHAAADQSQRALQAIADARQRFGQVTGHHDLLRRRRDVEERSINIKQKGDTTEIAEV